MDTTTITALIILTLVFISIGAFLLGGVLFEQKRMREQSQLTLLASLWAMTDTQSLRKSGLVRVTERLPSQGKLTPETIEEFERQWASALGEDLPPKKSKHDELMETFDFDEERAKDQNMDEFV